MGTLRVCADVVQSHVLLRPPGLPLKEDGLFVTAARTGVFLCSGKGWVVNHFGYDSRQFVNVVGDFIHVDTVVVRYLFVVAVPTRVEQDFVVFVLLWVEHVVALLTKLDSHKTGTGVGCQRSHVLRVSRHFRLVGSLYRWLDTLEIQKEREDGIKSDSVQLKSDHTVF
jgi:hypothetical protein